MPATYTKRAVTSYAVHRAFTMVADPEAIPSVVEGVVEVVKEYCGPLVEAPAVALVVQEALANAVVHGCRNDASQQVQCEMGCDPRLGLLIIVRDPGPGFDVSALPPSPTDGFSDHGRGIYLIRQLMDDVSFACNGAEIQIRKFPVAGVKAIA